jgi:hypothetical protein
MNQLAKLSNDHISGAEYLLDHVLDPAAVAIFRNRKPAMLRFVISHANCDAVTVPAASG